MKHSGTKDLPGPEHSLKDSFAHKDSPASGGSDSRDSSTAKSFRGIDSSIAHSSTHRTAHKSNPASGGPDSRDHSTAHPRGLSNPSDKTKEAYSKVHHPPRHISDHPPMTPPRPTSSARLEQLDSRLTPPIKEKDLEPLKKRVLLSQKNIPLIPPPLVKQEKIPLQYLHPQKTQIVSHLHLQNILKKSLYP